MELILPTMLIEKMSDILAEKLIEMDMDARGWAFAKATERQEQTFIEMLRPLFAAQEKEVIRNVERRPNRYYASGVRMGDTAGAVVGAHPDAFQAAIAGSSSLPARSQYKAPGDEWLFDEAEWGTEFQRSGKPLILGAVRDGGEQALIDLGLAINFNTTHPGVLEFIAEKVPKFSFDVNNTTLDMLRKEFKEAIDEGEGIYQITKRVEKVFGFTEKYRNERIARTEIIGATNKGGHEGMRQSGVVETRIWISTRDNLTRDSHRAIDGETAPLDGRYSNGLRWPGDYMGPAEEIINCRCTEGAYSFK